MQAIKKIRNKNRKINYTGNRTVTDAQRKMESHSATFNVPFLPRLKITRTVIHFHTSNFIPLALRQFYSIAIFPLKSFSSLALSPAVQVLHFLYLLVPLSSWLTSIFIYLSLSFLFPLYLPIPFSINNNSRFSSSFSCLR